MVKDTTMVRCKEICLRGDQISDQIKPPKCGPPKGPRGLEFHPTMELGVSSWGLATPKDTRRASGRWGDRDTAWQAGSLV